jgi:lipopolysaccharide export system permease protein
MKISRHTFGLKRIDTYIIGKFLGTYFFSIAMLICIAIVFDITEKLDKFHQYNPSFKAIVYDYYLPFIPFYVNLLSPLITLIALTIFTSKMANNTEVIAIMSSGTSFARFCRPYFIAAAVIALMQFTLGGYVIPRSNKKMIEFTNLYIQPFTPPSVQNIQMEVEDGVIMYIERYEKDNNIGYRFSLEKFKGKTLVSRLTAQTIRWDSINKWKITDYLQRDFNGMREKISKGQTKDTTINVQPSEFFITAGEAPQMTNSELSKFLDKQRDRGIGNIQAFEDEYYKRFTMPIAAFIMTLIGVSLSSRKVRGGFGLHLGTGIALSAAYIVFLTFSTSLSVGGVMSALTAVWIPNFVFFAIGMYHYSKAPK